MIRVFIADDHAIVRAGLCQLLATTSDITVAGEAGDGRKALHLLPGLGVDVLILDLSLPVLSGMEVLRRVRAEHPALPVLVLSMYAEQQYARRLLAAGAAGYLSKDSSAEDLLSAIRQVAAGRSFVPPGGAQAWAAAPESGGAPHETLSAREHQIFTLLFQGRAVTEIAAELDLSPSTVSTHVARIKTKLGAHTVAEIVSYAHRVGLAG